MDNLLEKTKYEECEFIAKSSRGLKVHQSTQHRISQVDGANDQEENKSKQTQTDETCPFCQDIIESKEVHNVRGCCPKNKEAQTIHYLCGPRACWNNKPMLIQDLYLKC